MADTARLHPRRRPLAAGAGGLIVVAIVVGVVLWSTGASGSSGYRTAMATKATVRQTLDVSGTVEPVSQGTAAFQVAGTVSKVDVTVGQQVKAGQTLAALGTSTLRQDVAQAQLTLQAAQAALSENEANQAASTSTSASPGARSAATAALVSGRPTAAVGDAVLTSSTSPLASTPPGGTKGGGSHSSGSLKAAQQAVLNAQRTADADAEKASAALVGAQTSCSAAPAAPTTTTLPATPTSTTAPSTSTSTSTSTTSTSTTSTSTVPSTNTVPSTSTVPSTTAAAAETAVVSSTSQTTRRPRPPSTTTTVAPTTPTTTPPTNGSTACAAALGAALAAQQQLGSDQQAVAAAESTLAKVLTTLSASSTSGSASGSTGTGRTSTSPGAGATTGGSTSRSSSSASSPSSSSAASVDSAEQLASDQAAIDSDQASLIEAQQSLANATLTSPVAGTVVSVDLTAGQAVSADSSSASITVVNAGSYETTSSLTSSQVAQVVAGDRALVTVAGVSATMNATVARVGPVNASGTSYTYPLVVALPAGSHGIAGGETAQVQVVLHEVTYTLAVPTSAVHTVGAGDSYVMVLKAGRETRTNVVVGAIGGTYTQITSGIADGTTVVLADLSAPIPASSNSTTSRFGTRALAGTGLGGGAVTRRPATSAGAG